MTRRTHFMPDDVYDYLVRASVREPEVLRRLREETGAMEKGHMQIAPEQGQFMALLLEMLGARRCLEVGTFTGYSALWMALALPEDGRLVACDVSAEWTSVGRGYWAEAGVDHKIDLRLAPALETLDGMLAAGEGDFDFAFVDADKGNYRAYYERILELLRPGGVVALDNTLWKGELVGPGPLAGDAEAIRALNATLLEDQRVSLSLLPVGDGLTLARKR